jgi:hypothetical protein
LGDTREDGGDAEAQNDGDQYDYVLKRAHENQFIIILN